MRLRPIPDDWRYWVDGADLSLGAAAMVPAGAVSWPYHAVTADDDAIRAFLEEASGAGVSVAVIGDIMRERGL